jgi:hypothetical protein
MFSTPPDPLTQRQRMIFLIVALVCAVTRLLAVARSVWEWDEALFTMALRDYDVRMHHPHPPGFPVYIAMAKLVRLAVGDDFRALQTVNVIASMLVFVAVFAFAREIRLRFATCVSAGALFAFFPNVWFFGGGAFSDVPSIVLVLFAVTFLLKGVRNRNAYWLGALLLALAIGIRPQNFLVGLVPGLLATRRRRWWEILVALLIGVVIVGAAFGGAVYATGSLSEYQRMVREHGQYIAQVDSFRNEERPPLWRILDRFFLKQYQSPVLSFIASIFVVVSVVSAFRERNRPLFWNAMAFAPFAIFAWLMLDRYSISRFSIGYQPMFAVFLADGIARLGGKHDKRREWMLSAAMVAAFSIYTFPALTPVRNEVAPSLLAARAAADLVQSEGRQLFAGQTMVVFLDLVAPGVPYTQVLDDRAMPLGAANDAWLLAEVTATSETGRMFRRERGNLWNIARHHYFEIKLEPLAARPRFVSGWYEPELAEKRPQRCMAGRSITVLPPVTGEALLRLHVEIPFELVADHPAILVKLNGKEVARARLDGRSLLRDFSVSPAAGGENVLELSIDRTLRGDDREVGLCVRNLSWGPA